MNAASRPAPIPPSTMRRPVMWFATGLGAGLSPFAPGTAGSLIGVLLYLAMAGLPLLSYLLALTALAAFGVWVCQRAGRILGVTDHPGIVWDEIVGLLITMTATPLTWQSVVVGFALFRFFDILKPWPVASIERKVAGGLGVMLDDVMAGVYALACLQLLRFLLAIP